MSGVHSNLVDLFSLGTEALDQNQSPRLGLASSQDDAGDIPLAELDLNKRADHSLLT